MDEYFLCRIFVIMKSRHSILYICLFLLLSVSSSSAQLPDLGCSLETVKNDLKGKYTYIDSSTYADENAHKAGYYYGYVFAPVPLGKFIGVARYGFNKNGRVIGFSWARYKKATDQKLLENGIKTSIPDSVRKQIAGPNSRADVDSLASFIASFHGKWTKFVEHEKGDVSYQWVQDTNYGSEFYQVNNFEDDLYYGVTEF